MIDDKTMLVSYVSTIVLDTYNIIVIYSLKCEIMKLPKTGSTGHLNLLNLQELTPMGAGFYF